MTKKNEATAPPVTHAAHQHPAFTGLSANSWEAVAIYREALARFAGPAPEANSRPGMVLLNDGVAVIPIKGVLTKRKRSGYFGGTYGGQTGEVMRRVREAAANRDVRSIVFDVDSPGGSVDGIAEAAAAIREARKSKKIYAVADSLAASAAYWLAAQAHEFIVAPSGEVGSIGVFVVHDDVSGMLKKQGIKPTYIHAGRNKVETNADEPLSAEATAHLQEVVDDYYDAFVSDVALGRGIDEAVVRSATFGEGRAYTAKRALERGMVDRIATLEEVLRLAAEEPAREHTSARAHRSATARPSGRFAF